MDRAIRLLASLSHQVAHFSKKQSVKELEDKQLLINRMITCYTHDVDYTD